MLSLQWDRKDDGVDVAVVGGLEVASVVSRLGLFSHQEEAVVCWLRATASGAVVRATVFATRRSARIYVEDLLNGRPASVSPI